MRLSPKGALQQSPGRRPGSRVHLHFFSALKGRHRNLAITSPHPGLETGPFALPGLGTSLAGFTDPGRWPGLRSVAPLGLMPRPWRFCAATYAAPNRNVYPIIIVVRDQQSITQSAAKSVTGSHGTIFVPWALVSFSKNPRNKMHAVATHPLSLQISRRFPILNNFEVSVPELPV